MAEYPKILAHLVAFYPDKKASLDFAKALVDGGAWAFEVQFPFSDPSADGPLIQEACFRALEAGFTVDEGFSLVSQLRDICKVPVFIMTYANLLVNRGPERFVHDAKAAGASGLIVPDLVIDADAGLARLCAEAGIAAVPVAVVGMQEERRAQYTDLAYLYVSLRKGITGKATEIDKDVVAFLRSLRACCQHLVGGFGIRTREQLQRISHYVDSVAIGSAFVELIASGSDPKDLARFVSALLGRS